MVTSVVTMVLKVVNLKRLKLIFKAALYVDI